MGNKYKLERTIIPIEFRRAFVPMKIIILALIFNDYFILNDTLLARMGVRNKIFM